MTNDGNPYLIILMIVAVLGGLVTVGTWLWGDPAVAGAWLTLTLGAALVWLGASASRWKPKERPKKIPYA